MRPVMRSRSWSDYCRERVASYKRQIERPDGGDACIAWAVNNLAHSYRPPIFRYRTAKMLGRAIRAGKIKERPEKVERYREYINELIEIYGFDPTSMCQND